MTVRRRQRNGDRTLLLINNLIDNVEVNEQAKRLIIIIILGTVTTTVQTTARLILATNFASTILKRTKVTGDRQRIWLQKKLKEKIQKENKRKKKHTHKQNKIINKEQKDTIYKKSILIDFLCWKWNLIIIIIIFCVSTRVRAYVCLCIETFTTMVVVLLKEKDSV